MICILWPNYTCNTMLVYIHVLNWTDFGHQSNSKIHYHWKFFNLTQLIACLSARFAESPIKSQVRHSVSFHRSIIPYKNGFDTINLLCYRHEWSKKSTVLKMLRIFLFFFYLEIFNLCKWCDLCEMSIRWRETNPLLALPTWYPHYWSVPKEILGPSVPAGVEDCQ